MKIYYFDAIKLILRFGGHARNLFDKAKFQYAFEYIKNLVAGKNEEYSLFEDELKTLDFDFSDREDLTIKYETLKQLYKFDIIKIAVR